MDETYYVYANEEVTGPFDYAQMRNLYITGKLDRNTLVANQAESATWLPWRDVDPELMSQAAQSSETQRTPAWLKEQAANATKSHAPMVSYRELSEIKAELREQSAYSALRNAFSIFIGLDVACAVISFVAFCISVVNHDEAAYACAAAVISSLVALIPLGMAGAILDIADASLRKLE